MAIIVPIQSQYSNRGVKVAIRDIESFKSAVDKAGGGMRGFGVVTGKAMQSMGKSISGFGGGLTRNVSLPMAAVAAGALLAVKAYAEAESAQSQLTLAYSKFPRMADYNITKMRALNTAMMEKTKYDDDDLAVMQARLGMFGLTGRQIARITPLVADYATATGKDLPASAQLLGKAFMGNAKALKAVGINFKSTGNSTADFRAIYAKLQAQVGGAAAKEGQTAAGKWAILNNKFGEMKEQVGGAVLPLLMQLTDIFIRDILPTIQKAVDWFSRLSPTTKKFILVGGLLLAVLGPIIMLIGGVVTAVGAIVAAFAAVSAPVLVVIAVIVAVIAAVVLLWKKSDKFRDAVKRAWTAIKEAITKVVAKVKAKLEEKKETIEKVKNALSKVWAFIRDKVIPVLVDFYGQYLSKVIEVLGWVVTKVIDVVTWLAEFYGKVFNAGKAVAEWVGKMLNIFDDPLQAVKDFAGGVFEQVEKVVKWFTELPGRITSAIGGLFGIGEDEGAQVGDGMVAGAKASESKPGGIQAWLSGLGDRINSWVGDATSWLNTKGADVLTGLLDGVGEKFGDVSRWFAGLSDRILTAAGAAGSVLSDWGGRVVGAIIGNLGEGWGAVSRWFAGLSDRILTAAGAAGSVLSDWGGRVLQAVIGDLGGAWTNVHNWFAGLSDRILSAAGAAGSVLADWGGRVVKAVIGDLGEGWGAVSAWFGGLGTRILGAAGAAGSTLADWGGRVVKGVIGNLGEAWTAVHGWFSALGGNILNAAGAASAVLYYYGRQLIGGLFAGIKNAASSAWQIVTGVVDRIKNIIKTAFGINSPSKVTTWYGRMIGDGLANGITDSLPKVAAAMDGINTTISGTTATIVSDAPSLGSAATGGTPGVGGRPITIAPGAVQLTVNGATNPAQTSHDVRAIVDAAFYDLAREMARA